MCFLIEFNIWDEIGTFEKNSVSKGQGISNDHVANLCKMFDIAKVQKRKK